MSGKHLKWSIRHIDIPSLDSLKKNIFIFQYDLNWILNEHSFKLYMPQFIIIKNYIGWDAKN